MAAGRFSECHAPQAAGEPIRAGPGAITGGGLAEMTDEPCQHDTGQGVGRSAAGDQMDLRRLSDPGHDAPQAGTRQATPKITLDYQIPGHAY